MRKLLLGVAAISLSGCSFLGFGGHSSPGYQTSGYSGYTTPATRGCGPQHVALANGNCLSRLNLEGGVGVSYNVGGTAVTGSEATVGTTAFRDIDFDEAYETGRRAELGLSYAMSPDTKITAMGFIDEAESAGELDFGTVGGGTSFTGSMSDYKSTGVELGLRKYFRPTGAPLVRTIRPYVEGRLGASYQDAIFIENAEVGGVPVAGPIAFSDSGWVPSAAGLIGIETPLTRYSTVGIETGIRYTGAPDGNTTSLTPGNGLEGINNGGSRTSVPLMLRGRYRF